MTGTGLEGQALFIEIAFRHGWQSLLVFGLVGLLLLSARGRWSAEHRSWIWVGAVMGMALLPLLTLVPLPVPGGGHSVPVIVQQAYHFDSDTFAPLAKALGAASPATGPAASLAAGPSLIIFALLFIWAGVTMRELARLVLACARARQLCYNAEKVSRNAAFLPEDWPAHLTIALSDEVQGPMAAGLFRPCILLPRHLVQQLPKARINHLLAHELAHIERGDLQLAFLQRLLLALFWWNPLMHLASKRLEVEREMACDDRAVRRAGCSRNYAASLVESVEAILTKAAAPGALLAVGAFDRRGDKSFPTRIRRLIGADYHDQRRLGHSHSASLFLVALIAAGVFVATPRSAFSATPPSTSELAASCCGQSELGFETYQSRITHNITSDGQPRGKPKLKVKDKSKCPKGKKTKHRHDS